MLAPVCYLLNMGTQLTQIKRITIIRDPDYRISNPNLSIDSSASDIVSHTYSCIQSINAVVLLAVVSE